MDPSMFPAEVQAVLAKLQQYVTRYTVGGGPGNNAGVGNDVAIFMRTGKMPVTAEGQAIVRQALAGTSFESNPAAFAQIIGSAAVDVPNRGGMGESGQLPTPVGTPSAPASIPDNQGIPPSAAPLTVAQKAAAAASSAATAGVGTPTPTPRLQNTPNDPTNPYAAQSPSMGTDPNTQGLGAPASALRSQQNIVDNLPTGSGGGNTPNTNSQWSPNQATALSTDDDRLIRFALQQAGMNPDRMTSFTKTVGRALVPLLRSARSAYGLKDNADISMLPDMIAQLAKSGTQKGGNFFGQLRGMGEEAMGSEAMKTYLSGISNPEDQAAFIQSLLPARYAGANPMIQQSAADTFDRTLNQFKDQDFAQNGALANGGVFLDWLAGQQNVDPITRRIFGLR